MKPDECPTPGADAPDHQQSKKSELTLVRIDDVRPDDYDGTCLRPLGLCELGGCCDACWYRPDHPRFRDGR